MVFIEYVTPFIAIEGTEEVPQARTKEDFWEEIAVAFACLEEDYKGNIRRLGALTFFAEAFWPFWLFPLNDDYCTFLDALAINEYVLPIGKYPALRDPEKDLKAKKLVEFERKILRYDNYLKKGPSLSRKMELISGYLDRDTFAYLKPHFYKITKLYTDSFFVIPPELQEEQVLKERQKFNDFLSFNTIQELQSQGEITLQLMSQWLEHFQDKLTEIEQEQANTDEKKALLQELNDQIVEAQNRPFMDSTQDFLSTDRFSLPSLSQSLESDISLLDEKIQHIRQGLETGDLDNITSANDAALRSSRDIFDALSQFQKDLDRIKKEIDQERRKVHQQREDEIHSYQKQRDIVQKQIEDKETNRIQGIDAQKEQHDSFLHLQQEVEGDFKRWIRGLTDEIQDFFNFHAIPMRGSLQLVGVPILIFGFTRGPNQTVIPYLPKIISREIKKHGQIDFRDSQEEGKIKENLHRYIRQKPGVLSFFTENGKLHDLTSLPHFKQNIINALGAMRQRNWVTDKKERRVQRMMDQELDLKW